MIAEIFEGTNRMDMHAPTEKYPRIEEELYKILLVDDEEVVRHGLKYFIDWKSFGFRIANDVGSSAEALELLASNHYDVLLTDIQMPGQNGLELIERIRRMDSAAKILIISGYDSFEYAVAAIRCGVEDYLLKPFSRERVEDVFRKLYQKLRLEHAHRVNEQMAVSYFLYHLVQNDYVSNERIMDIENALGVVFPSPMLLVNFCFADFQRYTAERMQSDSDIPGMSTGFHALDKALTGLNKSDLILIAARPGMGKTAFALNIALNAAKASIQNKPKGYKKGTGVCVFQLEMGKEQLASRFLSSQALLESQKLKTGDLTMDDWDKIARGAGVLSSLDIYVDDNPAITVPEIKAKCRRLGDELGLIVIDYLQLMHVGGRHMDNRVQEVAEISRSLKIMAKELNVPVVCLSQLSRASEQRSDKRPMLSDLRESGAIEQDADIVMFIYRDDYYDEESENKNIAEIIIAKNRHGATGTVELQWVGQYTTFSNPDRIHEE